MKCRDIGYFVNNPILEDVGGVKCSRFVLAVKERRRKDGRTSEITNYFNFVVWAEAAELITKYKRKGDAIFFDAVARDENKDGKVVFRITDFQFLNSNEKNINT